jgi:hypothetical protein
VTIHQPGYHSGHTRVSPTAPADPGVEGNSRLTSVTGVLLIGLLAVEGLTILSIHGLITLHIFIGIVLLGPILLKTASTVYRFAGYYTGRAAYVQKGPPHIILRLLGPVVIVLSLAVLGTGLGLLAVKPDHEGILLFAHKATFILWIGATTIHVLGHVREAAVSSWQEIRPVPGDRASRRRFLRLAAVAMSLAVGVGAAAAITPHASSWTHRSGDGFRNEGAAPAHLVR